MKTFGRLLLVGMGVVSALQLIRRAIPAHLATAEIQAPAAVKHILENKCYNCHSDQRRLSWFDEIVPGYWLVRHDILTGREHVNFSTLASKPAAIQKAMLYEAVNMIQLGAMPLPLFLKVHPHAKVTPGELVALKAYLAPWAPAQQPAPMAAQNRTSVPLTMVRPEPDGFAFDPRYESWKPISTTDRGDNNTFRLILGNDIALKAAQSGHIAPWPDGTRFAKIAWQQEYGPDGIVRPGKFVQVELMSREAQRYKDTDGWGWGRWRGSSLEPYGKDAHFVKECTSCHRPMRNNDYVYTLPITTAHFSRDEVVNNRAAALPASLPYQPLAWGMITMYVDRKSHTTAVLYGDDTAMRAVQRNAATARAPKYPAGRVLALVTWLQRDDPHWFGARIPGTLESVQFVRVATPGQTNTYRRFVGAGLIEEHPPANITAQKVTSLLALAPVQMP